MPSSLLLIITVIGLLRDCGPLLGVTPADTGGAGVKNFGAWVVVRSRCALIADDGLLAAKNDHYEVFIFTSFIHSSIHRH